jgi:hypothetical protein
MNRILRYINVGNKIENEIENETDDNLSEDSEMVLEDYENSGTEYLFENKWNIWYHHVKNNWRIDGFNNIFTISNIREFWDINNNIDYIGGINTQHFFMMKEGINPLWEDDNNKNGGCWSIKIPIEKTYELWMKLSIYIVGENITPTEPGIVTGLSICAKNPITSVVKIWNNNNKKNSIKLLPVDIINEYGYNIIYKSHIPEY